jgi:hypothetical protein
VRQTRGLTQKKVDVSINGVGVGIIDYFPAL